MRSPVVVIGAGVGGLAAALDLASRGVPVLVLEKEAAPGGKMRQVAPGSRPIDAGPTVFTLRGSSTSFSLSPAPTLTRSCVRRS